MRCVDLTPSPRFTTKSIEWAGRAIPKVVLCNQWLPEHEDISAVIEKNEHKPRSRANTTIPLSSSLPGRACQRKAVCPRLETRAFGVIMKTGAIPTLIA